MQNHTWITSARTEETMTTTKQVVETAIDNYEDALAEFQAFKEESESRHVSLMKRLREALPRFLWDEWAESTRREAETHKRLRAKIADCRSIAENAVLESGRSVRGHTLRFVYVPSTPYYTNELDAYAAEHPEIQRYRRVHSPRVRIEEL